jgi:hypothetical protein
MFCITAQMLATLLLNSYPSLYSEAQTCMAIRYGEPFYTTQCLSMQVPKAIVYDFYRDESYAFINGEQQ